MRIRGYFWVGGVCWALAAGSVVWGQVDAARLEGVRAVVDQWVETRQLIAKAQAGWRIEKESLAQSIGLIEKEIQLIEEQIARARESTTQADRERQALVEENDRLEQASAAVQMVVAELEKRLVTLARAFPDPLKQSIEPLFKRIPENPASTRLSLSERMMNVVGILNEVDKFNQLISLSAEVRPGPSGEQIQVKTLYVGLSLAFFTDNNGTFGGMGLPGPSGWQWTPRNELARSIARAVAIYENRETAQFVRLPVTIAE